MSSRIHLLESIHEWDVFTFRRVISLPGNSQLVRLARGVSRSADGYLYPIVPLVLLPLGMEPALAFLELALLALVIERLLYLAAKNYFKRKRPANILPGYHSLIIASDEFSFPSGHSSAAFLVVTLLVMVYGPVFAGLYLWAAMVACSRVLVGVHFPSDTLVGSLMGTTIAMIVSDFYL